VSHQIKVARTFIQISFPHNSSTATTREVSKSDRATKKVPPATKAKQHKNLINPTLPVSRLVG